MLQELHISNLAVIERIQLDLEPGLNVLTGETGAGKTIILNALGLILGGRSSAEIIRSEEEEAAVEARFSPIPPAVRGKIAAAGYDEGEELIIKRVVSRAGKNRAYLNGGPCPLGLLAEIGESLVDIYGQHEHHALLKPDNHLFLLDLYGGLSPKAAEMKGRYAAFEQARARLQGAQDAFARQKHEEELLRFQVGELERAGLRPGEEEELQARRNVLVNAEKLYQGCAEAEQVLYEDEDALVARLGRCLGKLRELARIDPHLSEAADLLGSTEALLQETASLLRRYRERIQFEPGELDQVEARLNEIGRLKRKYRASEEELLALQQKLEGELRAMTSAEEALPLLERECAEARRAAWELAANLSRERKRVAKKLDREMKAALAELGMAESAFESRFADSSPTAGAEPPGTDTEGGISESGVDQIEFYFSPNPGEAIKPLAKIASGGELSRTMLAIKSLVLGEGDIPTLIFDEVDAGIGGRIAEIVGAKLKDVAVSHQVICVTHLPQIAAQAAAHYVVEKEVSKGRTYTAVRRLSEKERIGELARMLGGLKITDKTLRHAEEMLKMQGSAAKR